jgi:bifunctional non-homologous end joining protein LigD
MLLRPSFIFIPPALPSPTERPPIGGEWVHEIKHWLRMMVRPQRCGYPAPHPQRATTGRRAYPLIVQTVNMFKVRSCLIDGEAVACNKHGLAVFERLRYPARRRQRVLVRLRPAEA